MNNLLKKIHNDEVVVGVVGLGYVGLPLALRFTEVGIRVIGFDIDKSKIEKLNNGLSYINYFSDDKISTSIKNGLEPVQDFSRIKDVDVVVMCVPTPLGKNNNPDISYIIDTTESVLPYIKNDVLICLESSTYPGTTDEEVVSRLEKKGFIVGKDVFVVFSPEREDPGNTKYKTHNTPKIVGGTTEKCLEAGIALYEKIIEKVVPVSSTHAAEMTKLLENIFRAVNIGLVNELKIVTDKMGIDIWEVVEAAATKPFGFMPFYPGPGLGGHCIPIDPFYLTWKAKEFGMHTRFIELAGEINSIMPSWVVGKVVDALNSFGKAVNGSKILLLGLAYKKNIDDTRESPTVELIDILLSKGAEVEYSDPYIPIFPRKRNYYFDMKSVPLNKDTIEKYDCVVISTDHDIFDYDIILKHSKLIVDTRGRYRKPSKNVVKS